MMQLGGGCMVPFTGQRHVIDAEDTRRMESARYTLGTWHDGQTVLTAVGSDRASVLSGGLSGLLAVLRTDTDRPEADATTALPIRAEGLDVAGVFADLAAA